MKRLAALFITILLLLPLAAESQGVSPSPPKSTPSSSGGSSGGASTTSGGKKIVKLELEDLIGNMEKWKQSDPEKFDYLKKLLHIPFVPPKDYSAPTVLIWYPNSTENAEITRNEKLDIYMPGSRTTTPSRSGRTSTSTWRRRAQGMRTSPGSAPRG